MINKLILAFLFGVLAVIFGLGTWLAYWLDGQGLDWTDPNVLRVWMTAGTAFLGFFGATFVKFCLDFALDRIRGHSERRSTAKELLAELRSIALELFIRKLYMQEVTSGHATNGTPVLANDLIVGIQPPATRVFDALIGRIGILGADAAELTISVFSDIKRDDGMLRRIEAKEEVTHYDAKFIQHRVSRKYEVLSPLIEELDSSLAAIAHVQAQSISEREKTTEDEGFAAARAGYFINSA